MIRIKKYRAFITAILTGSVLMLLYFGILLIESKAQQDKIMDLKEKIKDDGAEETDGSKKTTGLVKSGKTDEAEITTEIPPKFRDLYQLNNDFVGWLTIDGTNVDYPVMQRKDDESFYIDKNFYKEESIGGSLFLSSSSDIYLPTDNIIIYGHTMTDGTMFGDLKKYEDEDFYREHKTIIFNSLKEDAFFEIAYVFKDKIHDSTYQGFKYYEFSMAYTDKDYESFINGCEGLKLYDTGIKINCFEKLLTLSTCSYHEKDGRLVIVAVKRY